MADVGQMACLGGSLNHYWSAELQYRSPGRTRVQIQVRSDWYVYYEIKFSDR